MPLFIVSILLDLMKVPTKHGGDHRSDQNVSVAGRGANKKQKCFAGTPSILYVDGIK